VVGRALAVLAVVIVACAPREAAPPTAPPAAVRTSVPEALPDVEIRPLGTVHGDWTIVLRSASGYGGPDQGELWAVPLRGGEAKRVVAWTSRGIGASDYVRLGITIVARQLSPDRRRIVLPYQKNGRGTNGIGLALIDLFTGQFATLSTPNIDWPTRPAWSPDGRRIAFDIFGNTFWSGIAVVNADDTDLRTLCTAEAFNDNGRGAFRGCYGVDGWTPDSKSVRFYEVDGYSLIDADTKAITRFAVHGSSLISSDWRLSTPAIALGAVDGEERMLLALDRSGTAPRIIDRATGGLAFVEPRWSPGGADLLARRGGALYVYAPGGDRRQIGGVPCDIRAEWHPNGTDVVYVAPCASASVGELRVITAANDALVWSPPPGPQSAFRLVDLAVVHYP
jgi:dipeptidyl aminopeptidase/acylaminoacyl peptidase